MIFRIPGLKKCILWGRPHRQVSVFKLFQLISVSVFPVYRWSPRRSDFIGPFREIFFFFSKSQQTEPELHYFDATTNRMAEQRKLIYHLHCLEHILSMFNVDVDRNANAPPSPR